MLHQLAARMILFFVTGVNHIGAKNILEEIKGGTEGDHQQATKADQENTNRSKKGLFDIFDYASDLVDEATDYASDLFDEATDYNSNYGSKYGSAKSAIIFLHGLGPALSGFCNDLLGPSLGLSDDVVVRCPKPEQRPHSLLPHTWPEVSDRTTVQSWFDFWLMPAASVLSPEPGEERTELAAAMRGVEGIIEELALEGVASENIVVSGMSQGGALTLYMAVNTEYKLGGFMGIVTWMPLLNVEPSSGWQPVNQHTPVLLMNGLLDPIVPVVPAGSRTSEALDSVFSHFSYKRVPGSHFTTVNPLTVPLLHNWLKANTPLSFKTCLVPPFCFKK